MQEKVFNSGDVMIRQGENDPFFYQIISGSADVFVTDDAEKQIHLATLKEGAYFGEMALLEGGIPHSATVIAAEDNTRVLEIPGDQIPQYYKEQPEKIYELMKYIGLWLLYVFLVSGSLKMPCASSLRNQMPS